MDIIPLGVTSGYDSQAHINLLKAKRVTIHNLCSALRAVFCQSFLGPPINGHNVATFLEEWLAFDTDRSIEILEKQQADAPRQRAEQLERWRVQAQKQLVALCSARDKQIEKIENYSAQMEVMRKQNPDVAQGLAPVTGIISSQMTDALETLNGQITELQQAMERGEIPASGAQAIFA